MAGVQVGIDTGASGETSVLTDTQGNYSFAGLLPGSYTVQETLPANMGIAAPADDIVPMTLAAGQNVTGNNFFDAPATASISGTVYSENSKGRRKGMAGIQVCIDTGASGETCVLTNSQGNYSFTGLMPGSYTVAETLPQNATAKTPAAGVFNLKLAAGRKVKGENFFDTIAAASISGQMLDDSALSRPFEIASMTSIA